MSDIPGARDALRWCLRAIADGRATPESLAFNIREALSKMHRKSPSRRAPTTSPPVTPEMAMAMRRRAQARPDLPMHEIASEFGVNVGRVSEAVHKAR
ncbi:hypothetical protein UFOVP345_59 [uncultured Caudovirales phage]|uniref:Uncharacterized protein n=1 Tax=uncultured Caudovirales phage TaxID=2100421 RepID=A0A6J5M1Y9_9CAUD|nr:hypothetical protein UFOVP345_59 [uncultured Caudovirales phage]